jgi:DNA-binding GntR family transcriptional regulator
VPARKQKSNQHKREQILATLRERIVEGHYHQGVKLVEQDLAQEFATSRPMLREILSDLENLGLVEKFPNRGTTVRRIER